MGVEVILSLQPLSPTRPARSLHGSSAAASCAMGLGPALKLLRTQSLERFHGRSSLLAFPRGASPPPTPSQSPSPSPSPSPGILDERGDLRAAASLRGRFPPGSGGGGGEEEGEPREQRKQRKLLESFLLDSDLGHSHSHGHEEQRWRQGGKGQDQDQDMSSMGPFSAASSSSSSSTCPADSQESHSRSRPRSGSSSSGSTQMSRMSSASCTSSSSTMPFSLRMLKRKHKFTGRSSSSRNSDDSSSLPRHGSFHHHNHHHRSSSSSIIVGNSLIDAFSSMLLMVRTLQSHTLQIRSRFFLLRQHHDIEGLMNQVHRDLHASFLWLFHQVFSCTPHLMLLLMILLADFTAFSVSNNLPISTISAPDLRSSLRNLGGAFASPSMEACSFHAADPSPSASPPLRIDTACQHGDGGGGKVGRPRIAGGADGDPDSSFLRKMNAAASSSASAGYVVDEKLSSAPPPPPPPPPMVLGRELGSSDGRSASELDMADPELSDDTMKAAAHALDELRSAMRDEPEEQLVQAFSSSSSSSSSSSPGNERLPNHAVLDRETMRTLVAPVAVRAEDDDYACYDRTDLSYQFAIGKDSSNSMLLANYAQFLFLVRKDHDRAEELFRRAVQCDPSDGNAITSFALFLWLARRNLQGAEKAYCAAISADPGNSFYAANYAYFLWTSGH